MADSASSSLPGDAKLLSTPDTIPDAPNTGSNSHKAGNVIGLGNQVKSLLPTPVTDPQSANGHARDLGSEIRLLPTTTAMDSEASGGSSPHDVTLTDAIVRTRLGAASNPRHLLPTPDAYSGSRGGSQHPDKRRGGGHTVSLADVAEFTLLPTPSVSNSHGNDVNGRGEPLLPGAVNLLPTPNVAMADGGQTSRSGARKDEPLLGGIAVEQATDWGPYTAAIERWAAIIGRPAPSPTRNDGKNGKPRLNPELTEWMMGWPLGWVTADSIGLSRQEQLKACGNGVVTLQAATALRVLLARPGVPHIKYGLAA